MDMAGGVYGRIHGMKRDNSLESVEIIPRGPGMECIVSCGRERYSKLHKYPEEHRHPGCLDFHFCQRGTPTVRCRGKSFAILPGNGFIVPPGAPHHLVAYEKGSMVWWMLVKLPPKGQSALGLPKEEWNALVSKLRKGAGRPFSAGSELENRFRDFFAAAHLCRGPAWNTLLLRQSILRILLCYAEFASRPPQAHLDARFKSITERIAAHPEQRYSVDSLARECGYSTSHFNLLFRRAMGLPPYAWLVKCRLEEAKRRIADTNLTISDIANDLRFASPRHLAEQFRRTYGMTPSQWRSTTRRTSAVTSR